MATTYKVQIKCDDGTYETNKTTTDKRAAERRSQDLAAAGYDGRIVTAKGNEVNSWEIKR